MRIACYERNGAAAEVLKLAEVPDPVPGPGEVRVRIAASGINPSDVKSRAGVTRKIAFPRVIPHSDGAGTIDRVGDGVSPQRVGERVWLWNAQWQRADGTAAEYVVLPQDQAVLLPDNASFAVGACLGIPALTAWQAITLAGAQSGKTMLVHGGAGAVGHYAVQFAKHARARVITTVSSPAKAELARQAGADDVINYRSEDVGDRVAELTGGEGVDAVIEVDLSTNATLLPRVLKSWGSVVVYGTGPEAKLPATFCLVNDIWLQFMLVYRMPRELRSRAIVEINRLLEQGALQHTVALSFRLDEIVAAHEAQERNATTGKILLDLTA